MESEYIKYPRRMFMDVEQSAMDNNDNNTMNLTGNTVIPLEYVEFELKHAKVNG